MAVDEKGQNKNVDLEERRLALEEQRLALENSFAKKWFPIVAASMVPVVVAMIGLFQYWDSQRVTKRLREESKIEASVKDEREWGLKVIEIYFSKRELFDLTKNPEQAESNLRFLAVVAPKAVQGVLNVEQSKIPPPNGVNDLIRLNSLAAVAGVQDALVRARELDQVPASSFKPSDFTVYIQYPNGDKDTAIKTQRILANLGYRVPGIQKVAKVPSRLQVRYYLLGQRTYAGNLATKLGEELNLPASPDNAILVTSSKQLPSGILEVWLPDQPS
jgi:hypothetical protein